MDGSSLIFQELRNEPPPTAISLFFAVVPLVMCGCPQEPPEPDPPATPTTIPVTLTARIEAESPKPLYLVVGTQQGNDWRLNTAYEITWTEDSGDPRYWNGSATLYLTTGIRYQFIPASSIATNTSDPNNMLYSQTHDPYIMGNVYDGSVTTYDFGEIFP